MYHINNDKRKQKVIKFLDVTPYFLIVNDNDNVDNTNDN